MEPLMHAYCCLMFQQNKSASEKQNIPIFNNE